MGEYDKRGFMDSKVDEYIGKFGKANRFVLKILDSLDYTFAIVDVTTQEVEITNSKDFFPGMKCQDLFKWDKISCSSGECPMSKVFSSKIPMIIKESCSKGVSLEVHTNPILNSSGEVVSVIIYEVDVTRSQALAESEEKFRSLFESSPRGMLMYKLNSQDKLILIDANSAADDILKISCKELIGKTIENTFPEMAKTKVSDILRKVMSEGKTCQVPEILYKNKVYEQVVFQTSPGVAVVSFVDITDKKDAEKNLREKDRVYVKEIEDKFYKILQNSQDLVYRYDFRKNSFDYVSESVFTILGYSLIEFMAMNNGDYDKRIHPDDIRVLGDAGDVSEEESASIVEYRFKKKNGKYVWLRVQRLFFRNKKGELIYSIGDIRDISGEKSAEEEGVRLKERIAYMRSKKMEVNERVSLTNKEKLVLWGFCRYPLLNDEELAGKLDLKRSTLTAIKNRLRGKNWFKFNYIPNFYKLGCQFFTLFDANFKEGNKDGLELIKKTSNIVVSNYQDNKLLAGFTSDKYVDIKKFLEQIAEIDESKNKINKNSFFYDLDNIFLYDISGLVNFLFDLKRKEKPAVLKFSNGAENLSVNEKRVLHAMIKDPEMSSSEIAKKIWTSKPTVIKVKKKLLDEEYVYPYISLNFRKVGFSYIARLSFEFDSDSSVWNNKKSNDSRVVAQVLGKKKMTKIMLFASEEEYEEEVEMIKKSYRKDGIDFSLNSEIFTIQKRRANDSRMESFISDRLFEDAL